MTTTPSPPASAKAIDLVFRAVSDPTRRRVIEMLARKSAPVTELASSFTMALPSFVQHLKILEQSGVVRSRKMGRVRTYRLAPERLRILDQWLLRQRRMWEQRLDQLDDYLLEMKDNA